MSPSLKPEWFLWNWLHYGRHWALGEIDEAMQHLAQMQEWYESKSEED